MRSQAVILPASIFCSEIETISISRQDLPNFAPFDTACDIVHDSHCCVNKLATGKTEDFGGALIQIDDWVCGLAV